QSRKLLEEDRGPCDRRRSATRIRGEQHLLSPGVEVSIPNAERLECFEYATAGANGTIGRRGRCDSYPGGKGRAGRCRQWPPSTIQSHARRIEEREHQRIEFYSSGCRSNAGTGDDTACRRFDPARWHCLQPDGHYLAVAIPELPVHLPFNHTRLQAAYGF